MRIIKKQINPSTTISFAVPQRMVVSLFVYSLNGELVRTLIDQSIVHGYKAASWDGKDTHGNPAASGIYFYRLKAGNKILTKKMVLLK